MQFMIMGKEGASRDVTSTYLIRTHIFASSLDGLIFPAILTFLNHINQVSIGVKEKNFFLFITASGV